jgi:hypothetical protein
MVLCLWIFATQAFAEPFGVRLLRLDSLVGWEHGSPPPSGWTIVDGQLSGSERSTPLLSAWTFGEFELRFRWSVGDGSAWKVLLPDVPAGPGLTLVLQEGKHCGQLTDRGKELMSGVKVKPRKKGMHGAVIRREGGKFSFQVDGRWVYEIDLPADRRFGLGLAVNGSSATLTGLRVQEPAGEPMFNGEDLTGWWTDGDITQWQVEGGEVVLAGRARDYLRTEKEYANFTWSFEYKMRQRGNSGLSVRTPRDGWPTADGMELQLLDSPYNAEIRDQPCMAVYGHVPPLDRADKSERWNRVVIKTDGYMVSAWVNGQLVQQINMFHHPELKHRQLKGWLGFQDHGAWIRVRNSHILEAPGGLGLQAWYKPPPAHGVAAVLDRLLNPERLSTADAIHSGAAFKTFSDAEKGEHTLADLTGPGAVVRIARTTDEGQLAFYFDGEKEPRIECKPGELAGAIPHVGKDSNPILTCLTYQRRLKVVVREAAEAEYRIDYVTLPGNLPVGTLDDPEAIFPRGWLSSAKTLLRWISSGRFHENGPLPRHTGEGVTLKPDETKTMVEVEGAGIVKSLKLEAPKKVLNNNDLWLEITVDGEKKPTIAAPVRYLFPALRRNYDNYVLADQGGLTNFLAMPFGNGIKVTAINRGGRSVRNIRVSLAVQPATPKTQDEIARRMRLRGVFQPASDGTDEIARQEGSGRWIGLVYQTPEGEPLGIDSLVVDGRPVSGWSTESLDPFLGQNGDFRKQLSGRQGPLAWRYMLLAPVSFQESLVLKNGGSRVGERLALFYLLK